MATVSVLGEHGYYLRGRRGAESRHRLAGPRGSHAGVRFPECGRCGGLCSPILRIDFDDPRLAALDLWDGPVVLLVCHSGCRTKDATYAWDYRDPLAPRVLAPELLVEAFGADDGEDREYESIPLVLVRRGAPDRDVIDTETRVGGAPAWLETSFEETGGEVRAVDPPPPPCPRCGRATRMLAQWSETNLDPIPRRVGVGHAEILGNPFIRFWFGCRACRAIVSLEQLD